MKITVKTDKGTFNSIVPNNVDKQALEDALCHAVSGNAAHFVLVRNGSYVVFGRELLKTAVIVVENEE